MTDRQADRQINRLTDRLTDRQTDNEKERFLSLMFRAITSQYWYPSKAKEASVGDAEEATVGDADEAAMVEVANLFNHR